MANYAEQLSFPALYGLLAVKPTLLSQAMHNAGFKALGLNSFYVAFDTTDTDGAFQAMRTLGIRGYSLTIPHKENAVELVDELSVEAKKIGAVNTIVNDGGKLRGENTDWLGIKAAFAEASANFNDKKVLIFGAGGAARAAIFAALVGGAINVAVSNRTPERAEALAADFEIEVLPIEQLKDLGKHGFDVLINCTPIGSKLALTEQFPFDINQLIGFDTVFDMVTKDTTPLLEAAKNQGLKTVSGLRMLLFQALEQFRLFTGENPPQAEMEAALNGVVRKV